MDQDKTELLSQVSIFSVLENEELNIVAASCQWSKYCKNQTVLDESDSSTDIFFVIEGSVAAKGFSLNGKEVTYTFISQGEMFGEFAAIDNQTRSASIQPMEDAVIARMSSANFKSVLHAYPAVAVRFAEHLVQKLRYLTNRVFEFSTMSVSYRLHAELLRYCMESGIQGNTAKIEPAPTHYEIAARISTHREAVSRHLSQLEAKGIVEASRKRIIVLDVNRLRDIVSEFSSEHL
jgi:CRP/FNR family cyclic AMP-dependent transcriptional regulator